MRQVAGVILLLLFFWSSAGAQEEDFGGVGLAVVPIDRGQLVVLKVLDESPAAAAGLQSGDLIVEVDGFTLDGSDFPEVAARRLWGRPGAEVTLKYLRPGQTGPRTATLRRQRMDPQGNELPGVKMLTPDQRP